MTFYMYKKSVDAGPRATSMQNQMIQKIKQQISALKTPARVEVRNYIKDAKHKYQIDIKQIQKMKIKLDPESDVYLEMNLFTNEEDNQAPLVVQLLLFDINTQNLIQEENLSIEN